MKNEIKENSGIKISRRDFLKVVAVTPLILGLAGCKKKYEVGSTYIDENGNVREIIEIKIKSGDTLWQISEDYETTVSTILEMNPDIKDGNKITPDAIIKVPMIKLDTELYENYIVEPGDNLTSIAKAYKMSLEDLIAINRQVISNPDKIYPGLTLTVPKIKKELYEINYKVKAGDTISEISTTFGCDIDKIKELNPNLKNINRIKEGDILTLAVKNNIKGYIVKNFEDINDMCTKFGMSIPLFESLNGITYPAYYQPGDKVLVATDTDIYKRYQLGPNETLESLAEKLEIYPEDILFVNSTTSINPGETIYLPEEGKLDVTEEKLDYEDSVDADINVPAKTITNWNEEIAATGHVFGIDISKYQSEMDLDKVLSKNPNIRFVYNRIGSYLANTPSIDVNFEKNIEILRAHNVVAGYYYFPAARNVEDAIIETNKMIEYLSLLESKGYYTFMPIALDIENIPDCKNILRDLKSGGKNSNAYKAIMKTIEMLQQTGYYVILYTGDTCIKDYLRPFKTEDGGIFGLDTWIARYGKYYSTGKGGQKINFSETNGITDFKMPEYITTFGIHQVSDNAYLSGYSDNVDLDMAFKNYPQIIYNRDLNHVKDSGIVYTDTVSRGL